MKRLRFAVLLALLCVSTAACILISQRVQVQSVPTKNDVRVKSAVKVHLKDGTTAIFPSGIAISGGTLRGEGSVNDITLTQSKRVQEIELDDVVGIESFQTRTNTTKTIAFSTLASIGATIGTAALAVAIFGSCPTVYSDDGKTEEAELFSSSIAPLFEARDIDRLNAQPDVNGALRLELRNEAMETHYINHLQVLEASHDSNERVLPAISGEIVAVQDVKTPPAIKDRLGRDVRSYFSAIDGEAYSSDLRTITSANVSDMDDWIDFDLPVDPASSSITLVFRMRNSLLSTTLLYDVMLGPAGARAIDWLDDDLTKISTAVELGRWYERRAGLHISIWRDGSFQEVARVPDSGPISWHDVAAEIPVIRGQSSVRVRLSFLADQWRMDYLGVAGSARRVEPRVVSISKVEGPGDGQNNEVRAALTAPDDQYLQTNPGQRLFVTFDVGPAPPNRSRTFFLSSQGYYTEWIRGKWIETATASEPFVPTDDSVLTALRKWTARRDVFEKQFREARVPVW
jgi:hypothetical protein